MTVQYLNSVIFQFNNSSRLSQYSHTSAGSESYLGRYDTDPRSGALVLYVTLVE